MRTWILGVAILGVAACGDEKQATDYLKKTKATEAELQLTKISNAAKMYYTEKAEFPRGNVPMTPADSCCATGGVTKCKPDPAQWLVPIWEDLNFEMSDPHYFRYSYESDGKTFVARAAGDLDCDGVEAIWEMRGDSATGTPTATLVKPARAD